MMSDKLRSRIMQLTNDGSVRFNCAPKCHAKVRKRRNGWRAPLLFEHLIWAHHNDLPFNWQCTGCQAKFFSTVNAVDHVCRFKHHVKPVDLDHLVHEYKQKQDTASLIAQWEKPFFSFLQETTLQNIQTLMDEGYLQPGRLCQTGPSTPALVPASPSETFNKKSSKFPSRTSNVALDAEIREVDVYEEQVRDLGTRQKSKVAPHPPSSQNHSKTTNTTGRSATTYGYFSQIDAEVIDCYSPRTPHFENGPGASPRFEPEAHHHENGGFSGERAQRTSNDEHYNRRRGFDKGQDSRRDGWGDKNRNPNRAGSQKTSTARTVTVNDYRPNHRSSERTARQEEPIKQVRNKRPRSYSRSDSD